MKRYVRKPEIIAVEQWFPGKKVKGVRENHPKLHALEGVCPNCRKPWHEHGWIGSGFIVCSGVLIATDERKMTYSISKEKLRTEYEPLVD